MQIAITTNNSTIIERREPPFPSFHALDVPSPYAPLRTPPCLKLAPCIYRLILTSRWSAVFDRTLTPTGAEPRPKLATIDGDGDLPDVVTFERRWGDEAETIESGGRSEGGLVRTQCWKSYLSRGKNTTRKDKAVMVGYTVEDFIRRHEATRHSTAAVWHPESML
jgi:hypothetical protein